MDMARDLTRREAADRPMLGSPENSVIKEFLKSPRQHFSL